MNWELFREQAQGKFAGWWSAWKYVVILLLLLAGAVWLNVAQWEKAIGIKAAAAEKEKRIAAEAESKAKSEALAVINKMYAQKLKDDAELEALRGKVAPRKNLRFQHYQTTAGKTPVAPMTPAQVKGLNDLLEEARK